MNFKYITVQGFRTFIKKQTFDISNISVKSLCYVTGKNRLEEALEGNDVGKSSLFEALCFCLFGTTSTKLRAGDVANWSRNKKCLVKVGIEKNGNTFDVARQWNPNKLILSDNTDSTDGDSYFDNDITQERLEDILGLNFSGFLYSVFISQFTSKFFDLDPTDKLKVFSDMLRLGDWLDRSEKAKTRAKEVKGNIDSAVNEKYKLEGTLDALNGQNYDTDIEAWEVERVKKFKSLKLQILTFKEKVNELIGTKKGLESELSSLIAEFSSIGAKAKSSKNESDNAIKNCFEMAQKVLKLQVESGEIKKTIEKFEGVKDTCPYCNQKVAEEYLRGQLRELDIELDGVKHDLKSATHNERLIREKESEALKFSDECSSNFYTTRDEIKTVRYELANLKVKIEENKKFLINYENDIKKLQKEINPFLSLKEKNEKECLNVGSLLDKIENTLDELNKKYSLYEFWVKGFKDIRLFVVSQALQEFEICINNNLQRLGLNDWLVKLDVERDVDKGRSVKRGFTVMVQSPYNDRYVSFKCWGGGVSQRLRLAGTMGLIDLIRSRTGVECNIEVWDEPTQWLSEQGIDDLLYVLEERAKEGSKKVFLIDHRKLQSFGGFYNIINIIKDKSGSVIEVR
tara:strand:- start:390 stop:2273 length:1884 start_codon:yes stop_codon:yes gene_type:complete